MSAHTPGPWYVAKGSNHADDYAPHGSVRSVQWWVAKVEDAPEGEANARLIAAAPEMYEALRAALPHLPVRDPVYAQVRYAISRADGQSI